MRKEEIRVREMEASNKAAELSLMRLKAEAEVEERKRFNEALLKMARRE